LSDVSPAEWIGERLHPWSQDTGSIIPEGFAAYARIFHPAGPRYDQRWADIAQRNGRIVHPEMQLHRISTPVGRSERPQGHDFGDGFNPGPVREIDQVLVDILRKETTTPDVCWFCVWEGGGGLDDQGVAARVRLPNRDYLLARGRIDKAAASLATGATGLPNIWWPDDRAWIVVSEIDFAWSYVGGSKELVNEVLSDDRLEALPARLTDKPFYDSDLLNAPNDEGPNDARPNDAGPNDAGPNDAGSGRHP
jgi:hypothetical protein